MHLIGVCGTGMGSLAGLLKQAGHHVTGSDTAFYPPMGEALERWGIVKQQGFDPEHLVPRPDLVVVGNVCRPDNPEARAAIDAGLRTTSFPGALAEMFLEERSSFVVAGTHGKTTTSTLLAYLLDAVGAEPGFLIGGIPADFEESFRAGKPGAAFVVEGDEYDSAFFEKTPKFWQYRPQVAVINAIEHDHIDIYPDMDSYRNAFLRFVELLPEDGVLVVNAADAEARAAAGLARCAVSYFGLEGEAHGDVDPTWLAAPVASRDGISSFDLFYGGSACGRVLSPLSGTHNIRNVLAAFAMAVEGTGVDVSSLRRALPRFRGIRRRQDLLGIADGVRVYDDFAHHPTAVALTLAGLRERHPDGRLIAVFEPRSATASRRLHQAAYARAFRDASISLLAPVGRPEIPNAERLDVEAIVHEIRDAGGRAESPPNLDALLARVLEIAEPGDTVVTMSNGAFGAIHERILAELAARSLDSKT